MKTSRAQGFWYLVMAIAAATAALFAISALRPALGTADAGAADRPAWTVWGTGISLVILLYGVAGARSHWEVGTREVVYMAIGAALYGVVSWATNFIPASSFSLVSLRPGVAIPLFFGWVFGPVVGFFTGAMGNILGDLLTGWGFFPAWDLGNGLMGLAAGLGCSLLLRANPTQAEGVAKRREIAAAVIASLAAISIGMGFAAGSSVYLNGYTAIQALAEFASAAGGNALMAVLFVPMFLRAWQGVRERQGR